MQLAKRNAKCIKHVKTQNSKGNQEQAAIAAGGHPSIGGRFGRGTVRTRHSFRSTLRPRSFGHWSWSRPCTRRIVRERASAASCLRHAAVGRNKRRSRRYHLNPWRRRYPLERECASRIHHQDRACQDLIGPTHHHSRQIETWICCCQPQNIGDVCCSDALTCQSGCQGCCRRRPTHGCQWNSCRWTFYRLCEKESGCIRRRAGWRCSVHIHSCRRCT